jgi:hypothetical protein
MAFQNLVFTDEGKALQLKAMNGDSITFTKVALGNGELSVSINNLKQLNNMLYECGITKFENKGNYAVVHWTLDTKSVTNDFYWTEYGIFAKDSSNNEILYAYAYDNTPQLIPSGDSSSITQIETDINIALGDAENVDAIIGEYSAYADKKVVENHINDYENPHKVTAEQIGLGNVENVSVNNATPTFTESTALEELVSGDKTTTLFGKLKTAVKAVIDHINNKNNPHSITVAKIGAAASSHTHSTTDINTGSLSIERGGTGASTAESAMTNLVTNAKKHIKLANARYIMGKDSSGTDHYICGVTGDNEVMLGNNTLKITHIHAYDNICIRVGNSDSNYKWWHINSSGHYYPNATTQAIGTSSKRINRVYATASENVSSDRKLKENIKDIEIGTALLNLLKFKEFNFIGTDELRCGLIAQDVFDIFQSLGVKNSTVYTVSLKNTDKPEFEDLTDEQILQYDDKDLEWSLDYQQITNYLLAGFIEYQKSTEKRLKKLEDELLKG